MKDSRASFEKVLNFGGMSCAAGVFLGMVLLGTCAGAAVKSPAIGGLAGAAFGIGFAAVLIAVVFFVTRTSAELRAAREKLARLDKIEGEK